jgi:CheY-like chemotaxis protein
VVAAKDGAGALKEIAGAPFDLMLLDIWMPKMNGLEVLTRLKAIDARPRIVVMTSDDTPETLLQAVREEAYDYVKKPVAPADLVSLVADVLSAKTEPPRIDVVSARSNWIELLVPCDREAAARIQGFLAHLDTGLPEDVRDSIGYAFRELLLNAVEWGGKARSHAQGADRLPESRSILDVPDRRSGPGFRFEGLVHAAVGHPPDQPIAHMEEREKLGLRPGGFGILTVRAKVDELLYNEAQNEVVFIKYLD